MTRLLSTIYEGQTHFAVIPYVAMRGQLDIVTDEEAPYLKVVVSNVVQLKTSTKEWIFWKDRMERYPSIEEAVSVIKEHKVWNRKTNGLTFQNCGPAAEAPYREDKNEPLHPNEVIRMKAMEPFLKSGYQEMRNLARNEKWSQN